MKINKQVVVKEYIKVNEEQLGILQKKFIYLFAWQISNFDIGSVWENLSALLITASQTSDATAVLTGTSTQLFLIGSVLGQ